MFRRTVRRLIMEGERKFSFPGESPHMNSTGGLPFYGNIYAGRVDGQNYIPPNQGGSGLLTMNKRLWNDPVVRSRIEQCPYFALCDQVLWHNMDPAYLDPGLLTPEEHQLLLLFSRAYYEKWKVIHQHPPNMLPRIRVKYGGSAVLDEMLQLLDVPADVQDTLKLEFQVDDASLIAMHPERWSTAYLDPSNMDHFSGRVLEFAGVSEVAQKKFFRILDQMRRMVIVRRDKPHQEEERIVVPFHYGVTLFDLYKFLGLTPYSGQLKLYDYVDTSGTKLAETLMDEDTYFDYLVALFYKPDFTRAILADFADENDCTCRYSITVEPFTVEERRIGSWF